MTRARRQKAQRWGLDAETRAVWLLRLKGYRVLDRRVRTPVGEIDVVARRGGVVAMVEVKARAHVQDALEAVTARQQDRIARAAAAYLARRPALARLSIRFDIVVVVPGRPPRHIADAWRPTT